jgi:hypothetical protein
MLYRYRLHYTDGSDAGTVHYAVMIQPGEIIFAGDGRKLRVVDLVPVEDPDAAFVAFLRVAPA